MLASKIREEHLTPEEINIIISSSGLTKMQPFLEDVLKKSRNRKIDAIGLLELQGEIAGKIIYCEKQAALFKKTADRKTRNDEWRSREIYMAHRRMLKGIMDGVAFRFLNFKRPVLRQLAEHHQTGYLTEGFIKELEKAEYIVNETGFYVILNDLTNFLRYGDLIIITPEGNIIDEVKTTGKSRGNQKKYLHELIERLNKKVLKAGEQIAQYIEIPGKPITFLSQVEKIINTSKADVTGTYAEKVSPYLWVSSVYTPKLMEFFKENNRLPPMPQIPFNRKEISAPTNSLMFFDEFSPNIMPFSVFPFTESTICEIVMGQIQLKVVLNEKELIKFFRGKGWELIMPSRKDILAVYDTDDIDKIKEAIFNPVYFSTLKKGSFSYKIPREVLLRIESEFRSVMSIVDESEGLMSTNRNRVSRMVATNFSEEYLVWK